jgi:membrane-bound lytic murein transglycosylase A
MSRDRNRRMIIEERATMLTVKGKVLVGCLLVTGLMAGCKTTPPVKPEQPVVEYDRPLPPGQLALRKITDPARIPDFSGAWQDLNGLKKGVENSLDYLAKRSSDQFFPYGDVTHDRMVKSLEAFRKMLDSGARGAEINGLIRASFDVYESVGCDDKGTVLFTGYYTPIFDGSLQRTERFKYPLYAQPEDLVKGVDGQTVGRKGSDGKTTPYPPRATIDQTGMLKGRELAWLADPFEVYIAHVQGSVKLRLADGKIVTAAYAANNGQEYTSISKILVEDGKIAKDRMSLAAMIEYFKQHPEQIEHYTQLNPRYVFFQKTETTPHGSINEPVIPMRVIATDKSIFPRAGLAFISTSLSGRPYTGFALDQDTGGAIRAAGRCDIYMGEGDAAGRVAGQTYQEGRLYYLFLKGK